MIDLTTMSLNGVEAMYLAGRISEEEVTAYLKLWNAGPRFTQAVLYGGAIRTFDPEVSGVFYLHLKEQFGLHL